MARTRPAAVGYRPDSFFLRNIFFKYFFFILGGSRRKTFSFVFISNWKSAEKSKKKSNRVRLVTAPWRRPFYRVLPSFTEFFFFCFGQRSAPERIRRARLDDVDLFFFYRVLPGFFFGSSPSPIDPKRRDFSLFFLLIFFSGFQRIFHARTTPSDLPKKKKRQQK